MTTRWQTVPLHKVVTFKGGGTPSKNRREFWGGGIPWVSPKDMKAALISSSKDTVTEEGVAKSSASLVPKNSLLIVVRSGILSRTVPVAIAARELTVNQDLKVLIPSKNILYCFLYYFIKSSEGWLLDGVTRSATVHRLQSETLKSLPIPLPSLKEQKRIVAILDEAFAGIETAIANTERNLANARELYASYLNSVFSYAITQWEEFPLEKDVKFIDYRGKTPEKTPSGLRLITAKNVRMGCLQREPEEFVEPETYDNWMRRGIPAKGDVLFTTEAPLGFVCQLDTDEKVVLAQRIITMQPDRRIIYPEYLRFALTSSPIQSRIHEKATGATATGIKASLLRKIEIPVPGITEQRTIAENAARLEQESKRLEVIYQQKLAALCELKQSLLQKAFSGALTAEKIEDQMQEVVA